MGVFSFVQKTEQVWNNAKDYVAGRINSFVDFSEGHITETTSIDNIKMFLGQERCVRNLKTNISRRSHSEYDPVCHTQECLGGVEPKTTRLVSDPPSA